MPDRESIRANAAHGSELPDRRVFPPRRLLNELLTNEPPSRLPIRVCIKVSSRNDWYTTAWDQTEMLVQSAIDVLKIEGPSDDYKPKIIAVERYNAMVFVVFDIFHDDYDPASGHTDKANQLHVQVILFDRNGNTTLLAANEEYKKFVNKMVQKKHDDNGWGSTPPFRTDYLDGNIPEYGPPRTAGEQLNPTSPKPATPNASLSGVGK